jgi:hypothetical protein
MLPVILQPSESGFMLSDEDVRGFFNYFQRAEHKANSIGIILCSDNNDAMAKITLPENNEQILAARHQMYLPTEEDLRAGLAREREEAERSLRLAAQELGDGEG